MAKTLVRKAGGQLVETELQGTEQLQGAPGATAPTSPAGSAAAGSTPDQAKMAGTPAQRAPVLREAVAPGQTLQEAERLAPYQQQVQAVDQTAKEKVGRLQALGSYGTKLQGIIANRLAGQLAPTAGPAPTPQLTASKTAIAQRFPDDPAKQADVEAKVNQYLASRSETDLQALAVAMGVPRPNAEDVRALVTSPTEALTAAAQPLINQAKVTVGELDLSTLGVDPVALAGDLGLTPEALAAMTPDELQQAVQNTINREYAKGQGLRAEYKSASPQRRQQILQELRTLDASGQAGLETAVADLADRLDSQETVKIAGQEYNIQDVLGDDGMSDLITNAIRSPDALQALKDDPATAGLAAWIEASRTSLETLIGDISGQAREFGETQTEVAEILESAGLPTGALATALGLPEGPLTAAQAEAFKTQLDNNPVWAAAKDNPDLMTDLMQNPTLVARWQGLNAEQIKSLISVSDTLRADAAAKAALADLGITVPADGWLDNPAVSQRAADILAAIDTMVPKNTAGFAAALKPLVGKPQYANYFTPQGLKDIATSMNILTGHQAPEALRKLLGLKAGVTFVPPNMLPDLQGAAKLYDKAVSAMTTAKPAQPAGLLEQVINDGLLLPEDLSAIAKFPQAAGQLIDAAAAKRKYDAIDAEIKKGNVQKARDALAAAIAGPGATMEKLADKAWAVQNVLDHPTQYSQSAVDNAKAFIANLKKAGLDLNKDGRVDGWELRGASGPNSDDDTPATLLAATKKLIAAMRSADIADEGRGTILRGSFHPSTLPSVEAVSAVFQATNDPKKSDDAWDKMFPKATKLPTKKETLEKAKVGRKKIGTEWRMTKKPRFAKQVNPNAGGALMNMPVKGTGEEAEYILYDDGTEEASGKTRKF